MNLILALALSLSQSSASASAEIARELTRIEQQLAATWKAGNCSAWGAMVAPDWSVIHLTGSVITKAEALQMCKTPAAPIEAFEVDEISVRSFGDAAVVTGRTTVVTGGGAAIRVELRFTDVFIRRDGNWQVVASQATRLGS